MQSVRTITFALFLGGLAVADPITVKVSGQVGSPDSVKIESDDRWPLLRALGKAGGINDCGARERIRIRRHSEHLIVDRYSEIRLQDGDEISVDTIQCNLFGAVQLQGPRDLTARNLKEFFGPNYARCRGMVVPYSAQQNGYFLSRARFFDGGADSRIVLEENDLIVVSRRAPQTTLQASLVGEVVNPGTVSLRAGSSPLELLTFSGGFTPNADKESMVLSRNGQETPIRNLLNLSEVTLLPGDTIRIQRLAQIRISVTGEVREPGTYPVPLSSSDLVQEALRLASGLKETAATHRLVLARPSLPRPIIFDLKQGAPAFQDGDTLCVQPMRCVVLGAVAKPGEIHLTGCESLFDVVSMAGVVSSQIEKVQVIRAKDVNSGTYIWTSYDLSEPALAPRVPIADGDYVFVPSHDENPPIFLNAPSYPFRFWYNDRPAPGWHR